MKWCAACNSMKPLSEFHLDRRRGVPKSYCKPCAKQRTMVWRQSKPDYERNRYKRDRARTRERHLIRKYGVDLATYRRMLVAQDGRCAICGAPEKEQHHEVFHVDHCHTTGRVRGLLCRGCNHVLGHLKDDPDLLRRAIGYLVPQVAEVIGRAIMEVHHAS